MGLRDVLGALWRGAAMGAADIVPGVSGGTIAFITGIYDRLIRSVRDFIDSPLTLYRERSLRSIAGLDWGFVLPLGAGILASIYLGSLIIPLLIERYPAAVFGFFTGLIAISAYVIHKRIDDHPMRMYGWLILGAIIGAAVGTFPSTEATGSLWYIGLSGAIAITAMILPGVSGSYLLLLLGSYERMLEAIHALPESWPTIGAFALGALVGLAALGNLLAYLLREKRTATLLTLTGLMIGGLTSPILSAIQGAGTLLDASLAILLGIIGGGLVLVADRFSEDRPGPHPR